MPNNDRAHKALENLRKRLLDLTGRNKLLNYRYNKSSIRVIDELPNQLTEKLFDGVEMNFLPVPDPTKKELIANDYIVVDPETGNEVRLRKGPTAEEWAKHLGLSTSYEVPEDEAGLHAPKHTDNGIQTLLFPNELELRLKKILQTSESAMQEMGANILYFAMGFLEWFVDNDNKSKSSAPLFMVPVRLKKGKLDKKSRTYVYTLSYSDEDVLPNISLQEKLRNDFSLQLPDFNEEVKPEAYFKEVLKVIESKSSWILHRHVSLTMLNFRKLLMYRDLDPSCWPEDGSILDHPLVQSFLGGDNPEDDEESKADNDLGFGEEYPIDDNENIQSEYPIIFDADSSQHSALMDVVDGKNLIIEGPPGTGKSQTISNIIAATIAQNKSVLFVADKMAALDVVQRKLKKAGLDEFCLELHSHKSQKSKVIEKIKVRLDKHKKYVHPSDIDERIKRYEELKTTLNSYVKQINMTWKGTGKTIHEILMAATRFNQSTDIDPVSIQPSGYDGNILDSGTLRQIDDQAELFHKVCQGVAGQLGENAGLEDHHWYGVRNSSLNMTDIEKVKVVLGEWQESLQALSDYIVKQYKVLNFNDENVVLLTEIKALLVDLQKIPSLNGDEFLDLLPELRGEELEKVNKSLELFENIQSLYVALSSQISPQALENLSAADIYSIGAEQICALVSRDVYLNVLSKSRERLETIEGELDALTVPLEGISAAVGDDVVEHISPSELGLRELLVFLGLISSLPLGHWKFRNECFDNEDLDEQLPKLRAELEALRLLYEELEDIFSLDTEVLFKELREVKSTLEGGGLFRWLSSDWRSARKKIFSYAKNKKFRLSLLTSKLDQFIEFHTMDATFKNNEVYEQLLGDYIKGLDTDIDSLDSLRRWYKEVRNQYGIGFGPKVFLGNSILKLPYDLARGLRSLFESGLKKQLDNILADLNGLRKVFLPVEALQSNITVLNGDDGVIKRLLGALDEAKDKYDVFASDNSLTVGDIVDRINRFDSLSKAVHEWEVADIDNRLFKGRLNLRVGANIDNTSNLRALQNTLILASCIDKELLSSDISESIYCQPDTEKFNELLEFSVDLRSLIDGQESKFKEFVDMVSLSADNWMSKSKDSLNELIERNKKAIDNIDTLNNWLEYVRVRSDLVELGFKKLILQVEQGSVNIEQIKDASNSGVYYILASEILRENSELDKFSGLSHRAIQKQFVDLDNKLKGLQCSKIAWQVDNVSIPKGNSSARVRELTEWHLLKRECAKKTKHIAFRDLLVRAGDALLASKPCFMMSPMSVAQYLTPGKLKFDLVIMDEASQIRPEDALGALSRGGQMVIVGDSKQLPPSNFFNKILNDEDDEYDDNTIIQDSESILDVASAMFSGRRLRWHYRSQHENLIAFSNQAFYSSDLVIFPSPYSDTEDYGIKYKRVDRGCFINKRNMEEARIIAEAVLEHSRHRGDESIGVVAMGVTQRLQIESAIDALAKNDEAFRQFLTEDSSKEEPLFIKNLENVQGDERDVIFISMTYGPQTPKGKVPQRFGPINSETGWRRLNVLFTRAKKRMHVFSSMGSNDIVGDATVNNGRLALRDFLRFCETGFLDRTDVDTGTPPVNDFEIGVKTALMNEGFECKPQVGVAGFFIDLGVKDPNRPGRYLMGIECDGATYHSAKSARDRDRLRQEILEERGWQIHRIWSTDWFKNPSTTLQPIIRELAKLAVASVDEPIQEFTSEVDEIEEIVGKSDLHKAIIDKVIEENIELSKKLIKFDEKVVRKELPDTPDNQRLLRQPMLEAFLENLPTDRSEFFESIPPYLIKSTNGKENKFLDDVLDIILFDKTFKK